MDDIVIATDDEQLLLDAMISGRDVFKNVGFNLHKIVANSPLLQDRLNAANVLHKVLGLSYTPSEDTFTLTSYVKEAPKLTKRGVLCLLGSIYDPLGLVSPVKFRLKRLLSLPGQNLDQELPEDAQKVLLKVHQQLPLLNDIVWNRDCPGDELIAFCDASNDGLGYCIYVLNSDNMNMLCAGSKIVPVDSKRTTPCLELMALQMATRKVVEVAQAIGVKKMKVLSDSMINLHRLADVPNKFQSFVATRLLVVQKLATAHDIRFFHVDTKANPADIYSRFIDIADFVKVPALFSRPPPAMTKAFDVVKVYSVSKAVVARGDKFSSFNGLIGSSLTDTLNRVHVFLKACKLFARKKIRCTKPTSAEVWRFLIYWQQSLASTRGIKAAWDFVGRIIRIKTKIPGFSPVWVPKESPLVLQIVSFYHLSLMHAGIERTHGEIFQKFHIPGLRRIVKGFIFKCRHCAIHRGTPLRQPAGQLPSVRYTFARPWEAVALDHFGPLMLRNQSKVWCLVCVCMAVRAVKIEVVSNLTAAATQLALVNIFAQIGVPRIVYSDNATNFTRVSKDFKDIIPQIVDSVGYGIEWRFSPPLAPWFNATAERLIGTIKKATACFKTDFRSFNDVRSLMLQVEAVVNNRVLFYDDELPVSPAMIISHRSIPNPLADENPLVPPTDLYRFLKAELKSFKRAWRLNYVNLLSVHSSSNPAFPIQVGDVVLVPKEGCHRKDFTKAVITEVFKGADGVVRIVRIRTKDGIYTRAVKDMVRLEVTDPSKLPPEEETPPPECRETTTS